MRNIGLGVEGLARIRNDGGGPTPPVIPSTAIRVPTGAGFTRSLAGLAVEETEETLGDFTVGGWFKKLSQPTQYVSFFTFDSTANPFGSSSYCWMGIDSLGPGEGDQLSIYCVLGAHSTTPLPADDTWYNLAFTKTGSIMRAYVNAVLVEFDGGHGTAVNVFNAELTQVDQFKICKELVSDDFDGAIRAMYFKNTAMSQAEIAAAMIKSTPITSGVACYPLYDALTDSLGGEALVATGPALSSTTGPTQITEL